MGMLEITKNHYKLVKLLYETGDDKLKKKIEPLLKTAKEDYIDWKKYLEEEKLKEKKKLKKEDIDYHTFDDWYSVKSEWSPGRDGGFYPGGRRGVF